jgi:hypothetical protein
MMCRFIPAFWARVILAHAFPFAVWVGAAESPGLQADAKYTVGGIPAHAVEFGPPASRTKFTALNSLPVSQAYQ